MRNTKPFASGLVWLGLITGMPLTAKAQQAANPIQMFFAMPTAVDPAKLFLLSPGTVYTETNDPNNTGNTVITGNTLLSGLLNGEGGLEIHGRFAGVAPLKVGELDIVTDYTDQITLAPSVNTNINNPTTGLPFVPWKVVDQGIQNSQHKFTLTPQFGSAPMNLGGYYGVLSANVGGTGDPGTFRQANFSFVGFVATAVTPEPGTLAFLGGVLLSGGLLAANGKRRRSRQ